jgi:hypothetical protein
MTDPKIEYLESVHKSDAAVKLMLEGVAKIREGGIDGIRLAAEVAPDQLIEAFVGMATVLEMIQEDKLHMIEDHFKLLDQLEEISKNL